MVSSHVCHRYISYSELKALTDLSWPNYGQRAEAKEMCDISTLINIGFVSAHVTRVLMCQLNLSKYCNAFSSPFCWYYCLAGKVPVAWFYQKSGFLWHKSRHCTVRLANALPLGTQTNPLSNCVKVTVLSPFTPRPPPPRPKVWQVQWFSVVLNENWKHKLVGCYNLGYHQAPFHTLCDPHSHRNAALCHSARRCGGFSHKAWVE